MNSHSDSDTDREIDDTIRMYLVTCYTNAEDGREFTREELEERFATDTGLRTWASDVIGIDPDTLVPHTPIGRAFINVCMNAWVGKIKGLSDEDTGLDHGVGHLAHSDQKQYDAGFYTQAGGVIQVTGSL
jgi:hypothetical protein